MVRKFDLLAISLLVFSVVLVVWLGLFGPTNTTSWKDWQPLMAAVIALGGASIVYRGAILAYRASMAKVDFDREVHARGVSRMTVGVCLRLEYTLRELSFEVRQQRVKIPEHSRDQSNSVQINTFNLNMVTTWDEAWANLDRFPRELARTIGDIRGAYFDYCVLIRQHQGRQWTYGGATVMPAEVVRLRDSLKFMYDECKLASEQVANLIASLPE